MYDGIDPGKEREIVIRSHRIVHRKSPSYDWRSMVVPLEMPQPAPSVRLSEAPPHKSLTDHTVIANVIIEHTQEGPQLNIDNLFGSDTCDRRVIACLGGIPLLRALNAGHRSAPFRKTEAVREAWGIVWHRWGEKLYGHQAWRLTLELEEVTDQLFYPE